LLLDDPKVFRSEISDAQYFFFFSFLIQSLDIVVVVEVPSFDPLDPVWRTHSQGDTVPVLAFFLQMLC